MNPARGVEHYIITVPDERLRSRWPEADIEISKGTLKRMLELSKRGATDTRTLAGLSSVQVEMPGRAVTVNHQDRGWIGFINPVIIKRSYQHRIALEGCFSLPDVSVMVKRPVSIVIQSTDIQGRPMQAMLEGLAARFACHEIDHINGILITDYEVQKVA